MIAKYRIVFRIASGETTNTKRLISASNMDATNRDINWESRMPARSPTPREITPITAVSTRRIFEISPFLIPSVRYTPNSFFRFRIRNRLA